MPRKSRNVVSEETVRAAVAAFQKLPPAGRAVAVGLLLVGGLIWLLAQRPAVPPSGRGGEDVPATGSPLPDGSGRYLFCFWNVENLFDDRDDNRRPADEEYDDPFATDARLRQLKYDRLASALLRMNGGAGPDVIACVEVESVRAAELLRDALNARLPDPARRYEHLAMKDLDAGRHIAPCVITRLPVDAARTRLLGSRLRILETHLRVGGADLALFVTHWTSQVTQRGDAGGTDTGRGKYAATIHEAFAGAVRANPAADLLVCGDFNDTPDSTPVVQLLGATADRTLVTPTANPPRLLNLLADKPADRYGTHYYNRPLVYDQVCVSAGMLDDRGWGCDPESVRVVTDGLIRTGSTRRRQPWRFGNPEPPMTDADRGYSDHFPVTVELTVRP